MSDEFNRRLAAARDRAIAAREREEQSTADTAERQAEQRRRAIKAWDERLLGLINRAVSEANNRIRGSGTKLATLDSTDLSRGGQGLLLPSKTIFGTPESDPAATLGALDPHLLIGVEEDGAISWGVRHATYVSSGNKVPPENFGQEQVEAAIATFVEVIVGA